MKQDRTTKKNAKLLQQRLASTFLYLSHSLSPGTLITVTEVQISPDSSLAKVYLSLFNTESKEDALKKIQEKEALIKHHLSQTTAKNARRVPELHFYLDNTAEEAEYMDKLLDSISLKE